MKLPGAEALVHALTPALSLPALAPRRGFLTRLLLDFQRAEQEGEAALVVALVGATGAGKSTLLNALTQSHIAHEGTDRPTSKEAVVYAPDDAETSALERTRARVERYRVLPAAPWSGQVFVDTPDLNSVEPSHQEVARAVLDVADVALLVLHRGSVAEAAQAAFLADFAQRRRLVLVLNFADELGPDSRETLKAQARKLFAQAWHTQPEALPCFAISAREAQRSRAAAGEFEGLVHWLTRLADASTALSIRRSNAGATFEALQRETLPALREVATLERSVEISLDQGLTRTERRWGEDFSLRLLGAQSHLRDVARRQAASRGWGPLALVLRWSGWGGGGLAASTLLLRQSLPVGLVVAGATAAMEQLSRRTRERAADAAVLETGVRSAEDDDGTCAQAARAALLEPRALLQQAGHDPEAWGVPSVPVLTTAVMEARAEAWRFAQGRAVAEAVESWWRWARVLLFPLFNLLLLGLGAHAAYRVGRAYLEGEYLDTRYYWNALALGLVWTVAGTGGVALSLRGALVRTRARALQHFAERLTFLRGEVMEGVRTTARPWQTAREALESEPR